MHDDGRLSLEVWTLNASALQPSDVLLYSPSSLYGKLIAIKTWHSISHVEVYVGANQSVASRDKKGVGQYAARLDGVQYVLRPNRPVDLAAGLAWFERDAKGQPYGWLDLLAFLGSTRDRKGMVCSPFATLFLRACGLPIFRDEPANKVAPCTFLYSEMLDDVTTSCASE